MTPATILIVDDEGRNRRLLQALLGPEGYLTRTAASGEEALASIADDPPDLILLDVMMPGIDGRQVAANVKADPATRNIPIIIVTARTDREARLLALTSGAEEFLTKPIDRAELWLRVRNLLRLKELGDLLESRRANLEAQVQARTADLQRFRTAMDATSEAIFLVDRTTMRFIEVNTTATQMLGYSREELLGLGPGDLDPGSRDQLAALYDGIIAGQRRTESKMVVRRKDDSTFPVEVHRHAQHTGTGWIIVTVLHDITAREQALAGRAAALARLRATVDSLLDPHVLLGAVRDQDLHIVDFVYADANPAACQYSGVPYRDLIGSRLLDLLTDHDCGQLDAYRYVVDSGEPLVLDDVEYPQGVPGGAARRYDLRATRAGDAVSLTWRDVSERHAAKERRDQFLSHVSHELRSPLAVVHQFTSLLADRVGGPLTEDQAEFLTVVLRNVGQLKGMIDDLLEVSRAESGRMTVDCRELNLGELLTETTAGTIWSAKDHQITLRLKCGDLPTVFADPDRVREVLTNLLDNALKFTPSGGTITVEATRRDGAVAVSVRDTGRGIPPSAIESIFEQFYQVDHAGEESRNGLGLGLFICRDLIEREGGRIAASHTPGGGTTVTFTLPVHTLHHQRVSR